MKRNYDLTSSEQIIFLSSLVNLIEDLQKRDVPAERLDAVKELKSKFVYQMDKNDVGLLNFYMPDNFPLRRREVEKSSFTCGWCKERIASDDMSTHIRGCRVTIDDVRNDLSTWLEE